VTAPQTWAAAAAVAALAAIAAAGCGVTRLQTARTVPAGETVTTIGAGAVHSATRSQLVSNVPVEIMVRHGAAAQVDWGLRTFGGLGALADVKWNLVPAGDRAALAISAGAGAALDPTPSPVEGTRVARVVHVPVAVTGSVAVRPWLTPYAAIGYGAYWIFDYAARDPNVTYAARTGTGDGLLTLHVGVELARASGRALLLEYTRAIPVVNDPGDQFSFAVTQFVSIAFCTGGAGAPPILSR
jgi:hypothetical protein